MKSAVYEVPHYVTFSSLLSFPLFGSDILLGIGKYFLVLN
jgi:hypothetical protein